MDAIDSHASGSRDEQRQRPGALSRPSILGAEDPQSSATTASSNAPHQSSSTSAETRTASCNKRAASAGPNDDHAPVASKRAKKNQVPTMDDAATSSTQTLQIKVTELEGQVKRLQARNTRLERERRAEKSGRAREVGQFLARIDDLQRKLCDEKAAVRRAQDFYLELVVESMKTSRGLNFLMRRLSSLMRRVHKQLDVSRQIWKIVMAMVPLYGIAVEVRPAEAQRCAEAILATLQEPVASDIGADQDLAQLDEDLARLDALDKWSELVQSSTEAVLRCRNDATLGRLEEVLRESAARRRADAASSRP